MNAPLRLLVLLLFAMPASAQVLVDGFDDGDFSANPIWEGDVANFVVNADSELQLQATDAGQSVLFSSYSAASLNTMEWRLWVKQSFSPSANNHSRVYLSAQAPIAAPDGLNSLGVQGYFLLLGEAGSDDAISLYRDDLDGEAAVLLASGTPGLVASSFEIGLRVTRDEFGNWEVWADASGGQDYTLEATATDLTYATSTSTGVTCTYTASNSEKFYFDQWFFGPLEVDETAPSAVSAEALDEHTVLLVFDEGLNQASAETTGNYLLGGAEASDAQLFPAPENVTLTFTTAFESGVEQTLTVTGVEDLAGNASASQDVLFTWTAPVQPSARQVVFNEIMADPDPAVGLPVVEYLELHNPSAETFDLQDWVLVNTTTEKTLSNHVLAPGGFVVLCDADDAAAMAPYGDVLGVASFSALANTSDSLTLVDPWGAVIDVVVYSDDWYQNDDLADGGYSLEQINPELGCSVQGNWAASSALAGGSPGGVNSALDLTPDTTPPSLLGVQPIGPMTLEIQLSEPLPESVWESIGTSVSPSLAVVSTFGSGQTLTLEVDLPFDFAQVYTVQLTNVEDCSGNLAGLLEGSFELGYAPVFGDLIITEIMADPDQELPSPNSEFVEIENRSGLLLDLANVLLEDATFQGQVLVQPGAHVILCDIDALGDFTAWPTAIGMEGFPGLTNSGRSLTLWANGEALDQVEYSNSWYADPDKDDGGYSLELINPLDPCSDGSNWKACLDVSGATPGAINSVFDDAADVSPAQVEWLLCNSPTQLGLLLDEQLDPALVQATCTVLANGNPAPFEVSAVSVDGEYASILVLDLDQAIPAGVRYQLHVEGIQDCWGNISPALDMPFSLPETTAPGELLINEILSDPFTGGADFVELINASSHAIDLAGISVGTLDEGAVASLKTITPHHVVLEPGDIVAVSTSAEAQALFYPFTQKQRFLEVESMPTYSNSEGDVVVTDALDQVVDQTHYFEEQHFALLDELDGVSLERISFTRSSSDPGNWHSASESQGFATPGYVNSQSQIAGSGQGDFWLDLPVFSPDNDGFQDVVQLSYALNEPGWVATVRVFDHQGREMRLLQHNTLLGTSGTFSWDGLRNDRQKARMGMYIVLVERFTADGQTATDKLTVALAHNLN